MEGAVKILGFGLAKACGGEAEAAAGGLLSHSPTMQRQMTDAGIIFQRNAGTPTPALALAGRSIVRPSDAL